MSRKWYYLRRWRRATRTFLDDTDNSLCKMCQQFGYTEPSTVVDHVIPHKGDYELFWDQTNWQGLCMNCHNRHKQIQETQGTLPGCDVDGMPIDPTHHWR
jgi:5-methylcytosine-specific restriction enzyme A